MTTINKPVHEIRLGSVRAAIWANITQNGVRHSVTISRSYRVGNDWKKTNSYGKEDLLVLEKITELAQKWLYKYETTQPSQIPQEEIQEEIQDAEQVEVNV
jgi:hypothetical protein